MNTDLLLPGLVGYFASMLYNQNNVAGESSPMTVALEHDVIAMLARMVGFLPGTDKAGTPEVISAPEGPPRTSTRCGWPGIYGRGRSRCEWRSAMQAPRRGAAAMFATSRAGTRRDHAPSVGSLRLGAVERVATGKPPRSEEASQSDAETAGERSYETDGQQHRTIDQLVAPWTLQALGSMGFYQEVARVFSDERGFASERRFS